MKNVVLLTLFASLTLNAFSQTPPTTISIEDSAFSAYFLNPDNIPTVTGKIVNIPEDVLKQTNINYYISQPHSKQKQKIKTSTLKPGGTFTFELEHAYPYQSVLFEIDGLISYGIYANKDLHIEFDWKKLKERKDSVFFGNVVKYSGTDAELNYYNGKSFFLSERTKKPIGRL